MTTPRLLLVEDDPTTLAFMRESLRPLPARVDVATSLATAIALARTRRHDLWLIDAHLPDGSGAQLLARLREHDPGVPAVAHTATTDDAVIRGLLAQGFVDVVIKPLTAARLRERVVRHLSHGGVTDPRFSAAIFDSPDAPDRTSDVDIPVWDDAAATEALNGNPDHVAVLRGLFVAELRGACEAVVAAARSGDIAGMASQLHRLRASCGFTGAALLGEASRALHDAGPSAELLDRFESAARRTLAGSDGIGIERTW